MRRLLVLLALIAAPVALAGEPGVDAGKIVVGGSGDRAAARYFAYVNARGGVNGRRIEYRAADDSAFVVFGAPPDPGLAREAPQLFGTFRPTYRLEGEVLARQLLRTRPRAKIAVLYQDDEDGAELLAGFRHGLGANAQQIVQAIGYDPAVDDVHAEVAQLRATRAQAFVLFAFSLAPQAQAEAARLAWRPQVYLASGARAVTIGAVSVTAFKDPADPRWRGDPGVALARRLLPGARAAELASMAAAFTLVDVLRRAGASPSRAAAIAAARSLNEANNPFVIPGIVIRTSRTDGFPIQQVALARWARGHWNVFTGPVTIEG